MPIYCGAWVVNLLTWVLHQLWFQLPFAQISNSNILANSSLLGIAVFILIISLRWINVEVRFYCSSTPICFCMWSEGTTILFFSCHGITFELIMLRSPGSLSCPLCEEICTPEMYSFHQLDIKICAMCQGPIQKNK